MAYAPAASRFDVAQMQKRKAGIVKASTQGILALFKGAGVTPLQGHGKLCRASASNSRRTTAASASWRPSMSCSLPGRRRAHCPRCHLMANTSSIPAARSTLRRCRNALASSAPASSGSSSVVSGAGSAAKSWCSRRCRIFCRSRISRSRKRRCGTSRSRALIFGSGAKVTAAKIEGDAVDVVYTDAQGEQQL